MQDAGVIITKSFYLPGTDLWITINPTTLIMSGVVISVILIFACLVRTKLKTPPGRLQVVVELLFRWFDNVLEESMGKEGRKFLPFILSLFLFVLMSNWLATVPGMSAPTKDLNTCLGLGLLVFVVSHISAIRKKGVKGYIAAYFKPFWFLFPSNVFSELSKVLSHSFRLFGNIFAGGVVIAVVPVILIQLFKWLGIPLGLVTLPVVSAFFGFFIGGIQAFVFTILAVAYITVLRE